MDVVFSRPKTWVAKVFSQPLGIFKKRYNNFHVAFWAAVFASLFTHSLDKGEWTGDGHEYLLYARAFAAHASPDLRPEDFDHVETILSKTMPDFRERVHVLDVRGPAGLSGQNSTSGFLRSPSGEIYSWHFWLYPALVAPIFQVVHSLGLPPISAFLIFNWAMVAVVCMYACVAWRASSLQKHFLVALFLLGGTTYYVWWPHPEVFTASLVLLALLAASDRRFGLAMFSAALATTQNPPVVFLLLAVAIMAIHNEGWLEGWRFGAKGQRAEKWPVLTKMAGAFALAALPAIFFNSKLGVSNPILALGWANPKLMGWDRLLSFFFDLNQGAIVALPGVILGGCVAGLMVVAKAGMERRLAEFSRIASLFKWGLVCVFMAIPSLATLNWNSGQSVFLRYAYWVCVPFSFGLAMSLGRLQKWWGVSLAVLAVVIQIAVVGYYEVFGRTDKAGFLEFKPFARYILMEFPEFYNPVPEIFIERLVGNEISGGAKISPNLLSVSDTAFRFVSAGQTKKLLVYGGGAVGKAQSFSESCPSSRGHVAEGGWIYFNGAAAESCERAVPNIVGEN